MSINFSTIIEAVIGTGLKIILLVVAYLIARTLGNKIISNVLQKATKRQKLTKARLITLEKLILNIFSYGLIFIFITMLFGIFEVPIGPLIASAGVIGLAIG